MPSVELPNEVIFDILSRLAVKDLLRFKCIAKSWHALISDPYLVKKHLERCTESKTNANLSLILNHVPAISNDLHKVDLHLHDNDGVISEDSLVKFGRLFKSQNPTGHYMDGLIGSCNGLVCLHDDGRVAIWNPSTRDFHELPSIPIEFRGLPLPINSYHNVTYGFGHDCFSDDYKVIGIMQIFRDDIRMLLGIEARVYSLKTNSWEKKSRVFPNNELYSLECGTFASTGNALHWVIGKKTIEFCRGSFKIVALSLGVDDNGYHEVQHPDCTSRLNFLTLSVLRGCLCIFSQYTPGSQDLWIMKEYGVKESWTKLISIPQAPQPYIIWYDPMIPLTYSRSGDKILFKKYRSSELIWYDLTENSKKVTIVEFPCTVRKLYVGLVCLQSLVPVNGVSDFRNKKPAASSITTK